MEIIQDTLLDTLRVFPFLFVTYLLIELIEHKLSNITSKMLTFNKLGPLVGSSLGLVPQCGFSVMMSNFFSVGLISLGTLVATFLATSDEMIPLMLSSNIGVNVILYILTFKLVFGTIVGYIINIFHPVKENKIALKCAEDKCHCEGGILKSSLKHSLKVLLYLAIITLVLNTILETVDTSFLNVFNNNFILDKVLISFIGLIPNCFSSLFITQLYLDNLISMSTLVTGLLASSGVGMLVLFKLNKNLKQNLLTVLYVIVSSVIGGIVISLF